jgi:hypothetical protein
MAGDKTKNQQKKFRAFSISCFRGENLISQNAKELISETPNSGKAIRG